jgi:hypothetical protein
MSRVNALALLIQMTKSSGDRIWSICRYKGGCETRYRFEPATTECTEEGGHSRTPECSVHEGDEVVVRWKGQGTVRNTCDRCS